MDTTITPALGRNWQEWVGRYLTEGLRAGGLVWTVTSHGLIGDPLGPTLHSHDDASEAFYFAQGSCVVTTGRQELAVGAGDFVFVPPDVPHNILRTGDQDLWVFFVVAPNHASNKWRTENFREAGWAQPPTVVRADKAPLPGDRHLRCELVDFDSPPGQHLADFELVHLLLEGQADVQVGALGGSLRPHDYFYVPQGMRYSLVKTGQSPVRMLRFRADS